VHHDMAILSMVGKQMRNMVGIAGRMFTTLAQGNVNIEMISQGANEINISCVIDGRDAVKALNLIHQSCLQIKPEGPKGRGQDIYVLIPPTISHRSRFDQLDLGYSEQTPRSEVGIDVVGVLGEVVYPSALAGRAVA
jgi:predicted amino acid-binding ACT domain protein